MSNVIYWHFVHGTNSGPLNLKQAVIKNLELFLWLIAKACISPRRDPNPKNLIQCNLRGKEAARWSFLYYAQEAISNDNIELLMEKGVLRPLLDILYEWSSLTGIRNRESNPVQKDCYSRHSCYELPSSNNSNYTSSVYFTSLRATWGKAQEPRTGER